MSFFGWSLPAGCSSLPGEEYGAIELKFEGLPQDCGIFWTEDGEIQVLLFQPEREPRVLQSFDFPWDDELDEAQNIANATAAASNRIGDSNDAR